MFRGALGVFGTLAATTVTEGEAALYPMLL
jgi:hypothetical protein